MEMMKKKQSVRHHYLPVFYLKGFTNVDGKFFVYDKKRNVILPPLSPKDQFFEKDLNNIYVNGKFASSFEEDHFSKLDTTAAPLLRKVLAPSYTEDDLTVLERMMLMHFVLTLLWRTPSTDARLLESIQSPESLDQMLWFTAGSPAAEADLKKFKEFLVSDSEMKKSLKSAIPLSAKVMPLIEELYESWITYRPTNTNQPFLVGDNTVSFFTKKDSSRLIDEVIFPLSQNMLLVLSHDAPKFIDNVFLGEINLAIIERSQRFIASPDRAYLNEMIEAYKGIRSRNNNHHLKENVFKIMHYQSRFSTFDDYTKDYLERRRTSSHAHL